MQKKKKATPKTEPRTANANMINVDELKFPDMFYTVNDLMRRYGKEARLVDVLNSFRPIGFKCPQCGGKGTVKEKYSTDMLAAATGCADWQYHDVKCPLCNGTGAVQTKMKPRMVQDGWEEDDTNGTIACHGDYFALRYIK